MGAGLLPKCAVESILDRWVVGLGWCVGGGEVSPGCGLRVPSRVEGIVVRGLLSGGCREESEECVEVCEGAARWVCAMGVGLKEVPCGGGDLGLKVRDLFKDGIEVAGFWCGGFSWIVCVKGGPNGTEGSIP